MFAARHYRAIATVLASVQRDHRHDLWCNCRPIMTALIAAFADLFAADNPRFDRDRFAAAANDTEEHKP